MMSMSMMRMMGNSSGRRMVERVVGRKVHTSVRIPLKMTTTAAATVIAPLPIDWAASSCHRQPAIEHMRLSSSSSALPILHFHHLPTFLLSSNSSSSSSSSAPAGASQSNDSPAGDSNNNNNGNNSNNNNNATADLHATAEPSNTRIVPFTPAELVSPMLAFGLAPRLGEVVAIPIPRPLFPGLSFDYPLSMFASETRHLLYSQLQKKAPFVAFFMLRRPLRSADSADPSAAAGAGATGAGASASTSTTPSTSAASSTANSAISSSASVDDASADPLDSLTKDDVDPADPSSQTEDGELDDDSLNDVLSNLSSSSSSSTSPSSSSTTNDNTANSSNSNTANDAHNSGSSSIASTASAGATTGAAAGKKSSAAAARLPHLTSLEQVHDVGVFVQFAIEGSRVKGCVHRRVRIKGVVPDRSPLMARVEQLEEASKQDMDELELNAYVKELNSTIAELVQISDIQKRSMLIQRRLLSGVDSTHPARVGDMYAAFAKATAAQLQDVLSTMDVKERLGKVLVLLKLEQEEARLQASIFQRVQEKFQVQQQRQMLKEQKKVIESMLGSSGGKSDKQTIRAKYEAALVGKVVSADAAKVIEEELNKISTLEPESQEYSVTRAYLDWLTVLPWGQLRDENFDIGKAERVLNEDHFGLEEVKTRILEIIASGQLLGHMPNGKIICLLGPPGVGKTSIGKSIARALDRQFYRFSVGGMDDVAEIKGHRRTYVGAMPGKLIQCFKTVQCANPVILIDEIDKLGRGYRGDPAAALLEVLDPEQNSAFVDHYLDVPFDLSKALFICTANSMDTIPGPLADRMDFINLSGYLWNEKLHIVRQYIEPIVRQKTGVKAEQLQLTDETILHLIRWYCREAGVRSLQKYMERIYRKAALVFARDANAPAVSITPTNLHEFVGKPLFTADRLYEETPVGVATGLAWTSNGGSCIFIESTIADQKNPRDANAAVTNAATTNNNNGKAAKRGGRGKRSQVPAAPAAPPSSPSPLPSSHAITQLADEDQDAALNSRGELFCTGQMGDVMKESSSIAYTVAKRLFAQVRPGSTWFHKHRVHLHVPAGSTPKDGPSAGITMVCSLLSLALDAPLAQGIAMTGELTLTGKVLAIGGVREKLMAARQAQLHTVLLPCENDRDYAELPEHIKAGLTVHFVEAMEQVVQLVFPQLAQTLSMKTSTATTTLLAAAAQPAPTATATQAAI